MKRKYISPELEVQKFMFENILAGGETDDKYLRDSYTENKGFVSDYEPEGDI